MRLLITTLAFLYLTGLAFAQNSDFPIQKQFDPEVVTLVEKAKSQMDMGDFEGANATFRKALGTKKVLPTAMSFYFAKTLYVIHQNQNAKNFIEKYINLAGRGGDYYEEAVSLKNLIDNQFDEIKNCNYCNLSGYRYIICDNCVGTGQTVAVCYNCRGNSPIMCRKCIGRGVIITTNTFGEQIYGSCDQCNSKGYIECPVCHGKEELAGRCNVCLGTGQKVSKVICNHKESQ